MFAGKVVFILLWLSLVLINTGLPFKGEKRVLDLQKTGSVQDVKYLQINNLMGQEIKTLIDDDIRAGRYCILWNGRDDLGTAVSSSLYFVRLQGKGFPNLFKC